MHYPKNTLFTVLLAFMFSATCCGAISTKSHDDQNPIVIKENTVHGEPRSSSILASINGHSLTVTFTENLGTVQVEVTTALGDRVDYTPIWTPDSFTTYLASTGSYVVTITLPNGDEYYGEFDVTE